MQAMILAAGRGKRMRPLTDSLPKPLLSVGGKPLIVWHIERLVAAGIVNIVINHAWLGNRLEAALGNGERYGACLRYSRETSALETAGGIAQALATYPELGSAPFLVMNGDIWSDWDPSQAYPRATKIDGQTCLAWLWLVANPTHSPHGDFYLGTDQTLAPNGKERFTFSGISLYHPRFFDTLAPGTIAPLAPLLQHAIQAGKVRGEYYPGQWWDIGTPQRLDALNALLS